MLILGSSYTEKINLLIEQYVRLIESGTSYDEILVILLNSYKKSCFIQKLLELKPDIDISKTKIYTIYGLCYNAFLDNYDYIRKITGIENVKIKPNLCGLEVSQYIFKQSIKEADFTDYISKINLLHQLFRRYSLIVQNSLTIEEVMQKSKILDEVFAKLLYIINVNEYCEFIADER